MEAKAKRSKHMGRERTNSSGETVGSGQLIWEGEFGNVTSPEAFSDNLDWELGNLISNTFPLNRHNFNKTFDQFVNLIAKIIDKHAPLQRLSRKQKKLASKPWITKGILISIRKKMPCLELISLKVISLKKPCLGFIPIRLQE